MAAGYTAYRPAVHTPVMARAFAHLECSVPRTRMLDVGCGAGLSTRAALARAGNVVGVDPSPAMIAVARRWVPAAHFAVGAGEQLPVGGGTVDVVTAAGSLNFIDLDRFAREAARVLRPDGAIVAYDFATGSRCAEAPGLAVVASEFARRWPRPTAD